LEVHHRAEPIVSQEYEFKFPKGQIAVGESFNVCVEAPGEYFDCKTLTNSLAKKPEESIFDICLPLNTFGSMVFLSYNSLPLYQYEYCSTIEI
jgi:hypothetical protein